MPSRKIRIEYYKVVSTKKDETEKGIDIDFPLEKLILKADELGIEKRTIMMALEAFPFMTKLKYLFKGSLKLSMFPL